MDRKEFLSSVGMSTFAFAVINCMGCKKDGGSSGDSPVSGPSNVDFTLDLSAQANAALLTNGGAVVSNGVIVARTNAGSYIAVQRSCTHESYTLTYQGSQSRFFCANHGSTFSENGAVTTGPANKSLTVYKTAVSGNSLRIYS